MKQVTIIDYGSGNLHSMAKAVELQAAGRFNVVVSNQSSDIKKASHIILPGVGAFGDCIAGLKACSGVIEALEGEVLGKNKPFLGVCVGMQMLAEKGLENGENAGLGWIKGRVLPISGRAKSVKIPHMGWNELTILKKSNILEGINMGDHAYFVHSFYFECADKANITASVDYGFDITAIIEKDNIIATQFHPEKSQGTGLKLISNFLKM